MTYSIRKFEREGHVFFGVFAEGGRLVCTVTTRRDAYNAIRRYQRKA